MEASGPDGALVVPFFQGTVEDAVRTGSMAMPASQRMDEQWAG